MPFACDKVAKYFLYKISLLRNEDTTMIIPFEKIGAPDKSLGGKAWGLGMLAQKGFRVPRGLVLTSEPSETDWNDIMMWWRALGTPPLAVRSSASAEDSAETSFAGQNRSFLNVMNEKSLREAVRDCFASFFRDNSKAYREFFAQGASGKMNVVLQEMVQPKFAGVFFSDDPVSPDRGWLLEVIEGLGEDLVSGKVTPGRLRKNGDHSNLPHGFTEKQGTEVATVGQAVSDALNFPVDMEWAFDADGNFFVLQARPITASASSTKTDFSSRELDRLRKEHSPTTVWDGQTFAEWSGLPSLFTFSLWRRAFSPHHAFGNALRELGYRGFSDQEWKTDDSLLERVFGRAYVNLTRLSDLYYGDIPYRIEPRPRPHTKFDTSKLNLMSFVHFPGAAWSMVRVAWNLSTKRKAYYQRCLEELSLFKHRFSRPFTTTNLTEFSTETLIAQIAAECEEFSTRTLHWPMVLVILTEATTQNLRQLTKSVLGEVEADRKIREWMGRGLHTVTFEMQQEFTRACSSPAHRKDFLARYGHRGPGEMDLSHPRWFELGEQAFTPSANTRVWQDHSADVEADIHSIPSFKREMILEEWRLLKKLLETREAWKMELLKPYAWLRLLLNELGNRVGLGSKIHFIYLEEILDKKLLSQTQERGDLLRQRQAEDKEFRKFSLPDTLSLADLEEVLNGSLSKATSQSDGEPLSPGIAFGEVRFVSDPLLENLSEWPDNVILAAVSTDPGWTPLFAKAKGIIVERGGVLSHCAILSREMGLPAIGGILGLEQKFKSGSRVWVDGNHGRVTRDEH